MLQPQLRPALFRHERTRLLEGVITSLRRFSMSSLQAAENKDQSGSRGAAFKPNNPSRTSASRPPTKRPNPRATNSDRPGPQRAIDARSLAASQNAGQAANILRAPRLRNARPGMAARPRKPVKGKPNLKNRKDGRSRDRRERRQTGEEEGDLDREAAIDSVFNDLAESERPTPTRYFPRASDLSTLKETWPSFPTDVTASSAGVLEKLSWLSERYPNGYVPPHELGKRLYQGQNVRFSSEEEKSQALEEAKKLAQQSADKLSQRKGDLVEAKDINFKSISATDRKALIETVVQGTYPQLESQQAQASPVLNDILMNLRNNETYQTPGKSSQLVKKVESLLPSSRPAKRA